MTTGLPLSTDRTVVTGTRETAADKSLASRLAGAAWWSARLAAALYLFVGALQVMKLGASGLDLLGDQAWMVSNPGSTLGLGWLGALLVLSGSPVAASALTLVSSDTITETQGLSMLTGSRLGAAFVVLLVAVVYALRGGKGQRGAPLSTAILALTVTALIYVPGSLIAYALLRAGILDALPAGLPGGAADTIDYLYAGMLARVESLPPLALFAGGLGLLLCAFKLTDTVIPELTEEHIQGPRMAWLHKKWPMFALGCVVALITMSVSVALTVLVPLAAKRYVNRWDMLPYIMGANIATLGDTLLAAFLLDSATAVHIVVATVLGTALISVVVLTFAYDRVRLAVWVFQRTIMAGHVRLAAFTSALFLVPLTIMIASRAF